MFTRSWTFARARFVLSWSTLTNPALHRSPDSYSNLDPECYNFQQTLRLQNNREQFQSASSPTYTARAPRLLTPSLRRRLCTCSFKVPLCRPSSPAIALFENPRAMRRIISCSRLFSRSAALLNTKHLHISTLTGAQGTRRRLEVNLRARPLASRQM